MLSSNCTFCGNKESRFIKEQEASIFLSSLGMKTGLDKILLEGSFLL